MLSRLHSKQCRLSFALTRDRISSVLVLFFVFFICFPPLSLDPPFSPFPSAPGKKPGRHVLHPPGCILVKTETSCCGGQGRSLPRLPACLWFLRICFCSFCRSPLQSHHPSSSVFKLRLENSLIHLPRHPRADTRAPAGTRLPSARRHMDRPSRSAKCEPRDERCGWDVGGGGAINKIREKKKQQKGRSKIPEDKSHTKNNMLTIE